MKPEYVIECEICGKELKVEYWADYDIFVQEKCCESDNPPEHNEPD